jgi:hypothetical protein
MNSLYSVQDQPMLWYFVVVLLGFDFNALFHLLCILNESGLFIYKAALHATCTCLHSNMIVLRTAMLNE